MKVTVSVNGRFHAFDLARELQAHGVLDRLITSLPASRAMQWGIARDRIHSLPVLGAVKQFKNLGGMSNRRRIGELQSQLFDAAAARLIPRDTDVFLGLSGSSLRSLERAKQLGAVTVLQRSSVHIETQMEMLQAEYSRNGTQFIPNRASAIARECAEYTSADYIEVPSRFVAQSFLDRGYPSEKILVEPLGVDMKMFSPVPKEDDVFRVIFAGGLSFQKGSSYLLEAMHGLDLPDFEFWHLGSINPEMKPLIRRYAAPHIKFVGHIDQHKLNWYYSQGSVFVLPSIQDGFGTVLLQAISCGLPVICSAAAGTSEILEDGVSGIVITPGDVGAIAATVRRLHDDPALAATMTAAAQAVLTKVSGWKGFGDRMVALYTSLAEKID